VAAAADRLSLNFGILQQQIVPSTNLRPDLPGILFCCHAVSITAIFSIKLAV